MLWRFADETVEDTAIGMLQRKHCGEIDHTHELDVHPGGSSVRRDIAPREYCACRPGDRARAWRLTPAYVAEQTGGAPTSRYPANRATTVP
jgi:hypothetical protein